MGSFKELNEANLYFYHALASILIGDVAPMKEVWSHDEDITYLGPTGGFLKGPGEVFSSWEHIASLKMKGNIYAKDLHFFEKGSIGIVQCNEHGEHNINGKSNKVNIRAINVFRKEKGEWKMISHQTDKWDFSI